MDCTRLDHRRVSSSVSSRGCRRALLLSALLLSAACRPQHADHQIIATVNGQDITVRDVWVDVTASDLRDAQIKSAEPAELRKLIDLKLLAQQARRQGLDAEPDVVALLRRAQEVVFA